MCVCVFVCVCSEAAGVSSSIRVLSSSSGGCQETMGGVVKLTCRAVSAPAERQAGTIRCVTQLSLTAQRPLRWGHVVPLASDLSTTLGEIADGDSTAI